MFHYSNDTYLSDGTEAPSLPSVPTTTNLSIFEVGQGSSSSCYDSPSSMGSCGADQISHSFIQRSISDPSLQNDAAYHYQHCHFTSLHDFQDLETSPLTRISSTDDLYDRYRHQRAESPISSESSMIIESMNRTCKYSPEEKKERIERYRSKRSLRNFNKRIKYACRKTLADSRPRMKGRFIRNDEMEGNSVVQWSGEEEEDVENWTHFFDTFYANLVP